MKNKYALLTLVAFVSLGGWYMLSTQHKTPSKGHTQDSTVMVHIPKQDIQKHISPKDNQLVMLEEEKNTQSDTTNELTQEKHSINIESVDPAEAKEYVEPRKFVKPIGALKVDMKQLNNLQANDTIDIPALDDMDYHINVDTVESKKNLKSIFGGFDDEGVHYSTVITINKDGGYMSLNTPHGIYEVEIDKGYGYVYHSSDIRKAMSDESKPDNQIIDLPKGSM